MNNSKLTKTISLNTIKNYNELTSYKYYTSDYINLVENLKTNGVAVIENLLNNDEIEDMRNGIWDWLEYTTTHFDNPIERNNVDTWKTWYKMKPNKDMLLQTFSIGQSQFSWNVRQNPKVVDVFSKIWSVEPTELITSMDAVSFHIPPEVTNKGWYENNDWLHIDSSYMRNDFECVQGFVTAFDINDGDATLSLLEGSNNYHFEFKNKFNIKKDMEWYKLSNEELNFYYEEGCMRHNVLAPAGSLILWDSRTVHSGMQPLKTRKEPNFRLVSYVCMTPKKLVSKETLNYRINAFENLNTTTHCPHRPKLFPKFPRYLNLDTPPVLKPKLTDLGKSLVGYDC